MVEQSLRQEVGKVDTFISRGTVDNSVVHVPPNINVSNNRVQLFVFEDHAARHVLKPHWIDLDRLFERVNFDFNISTRHVSTTEHIADILTQGLFTISLRNSE